MKLCNAGLPLPLVRYCKWGTMNGTNEMVCHCKNKCSTCLIPGTQYYMHQELRRSPIISAEAQAINVVDVVQKDTDKLSKAAKTRKENTSRQNGSTTLKKGPAKKLTKLRAGAPRAKHA